LIALLFALLAVDGGAAVTEEDVPTVSARADREEVRVGDPVTVVVTAVAKKGVAVNLPAQVDAGKFTLLDKADEGAPRDLGDGHLRREFSLRFASYEPGEAQIPPLEVTYLAPGGEVRTVHTVPIGIKVTALLANVDKPELKDIAQPVRVFEEITWPYWVAGGAAVMLLIIFLSVWITKRVTARRIAHAPPAPSRPAHEIALAKLDALRAEGQLERGEWKPFYFALSEIIREYLGARFGFDSLEMTTTELLDAVRPHNIATLELWCSACDLVKFAKYVPLHSEAQEALEGAYRIVDGTRPHVEPAVKLEGHAAA
jgi:hypothetical protein